MGINMDIRNEPEYEFLDLHDLDDTARNEILAILRPNTGLDSLKLPWDIGEKEYELNPEVADNQIEETVEWTHYDNIPGCDGCEVKTMITTIQPGLSYNSPQMIPMYRDFQSMGNPYGNSATGDPNSYPYISGMQYGLPHGTMFTSGTEVMGQPPPRENERRGNRARSGGGGGKRDSYHRMMNSNNDMQAGYMVQGQYSQMLPMCLPSGTAYPVPAQAHPAAGPPIYLSSPAPGYPQGPQMHHNSHAPYGHHPSTFSTHPHSPNNSKYIPRGSTGQTTYYNQENMMHPIQKHHEKRILHEDNCPTSAPPFRHPASNNNATESPKKIYEKNINDNNSNVNIETRNNSHYSNPSRIDDNNKTVVTSLASHGNIEVPDVSRVKDEIVENIVEKKEIVPAANIDNNNTASSVVVKDKASQEKEAICTTEEKNSPAKNRTELQSPSRAPVKIETVEQSEVTSPIKITQEELVVAKTPDTSIVTMPTTAPPTSVVSAPTPSTFSWASVVKKPGLPTESSRSTPPITKLPIARVIPVSFPPTVDSVATPKPLSQDSTKSVNTGSTTIRNNSTEPPAPKTTENLVWMEKTTPAEPAQQNNLNDPVIFRMGELLLKYQMDKQTVSLLPRGLTNRSNYCYINSILQALLACPPFYNLLKALPYPRSSVKNSSTPLIDNMVRFVYEFTPLAEGARFPRKDRVQKRGEETAVDVHCGVAFEPSYVYTMLKNTSCAGVFSVEGRQEDAEEFLSCLLNGISDEMLELMKLVNAGSNESNTVEHNVNYNSIEEEWKVMGPKNKGSITRCTEFGRTPLSDIFRGQLRSRVSRAGEEPTDNVQPFFTLQLDIEKAESVEVALEILVGKDQLEGMTCSKTKQQIEAWKQVMLEELPVILILHLKWFDYKMDGCSKIFKRVDFPIDLKLDSKFVSQNVAKKLSRKQRQYKLFAVTYHDGKEASKGHYVTDAFHIGYGAWVRYDDSSVKGIYETDVLHPSPPRVPYLLYYRRCDTIGNNQPNTTRTR